MTTDGLVTVAETYDRETREPTHRGLYCAEIFGAATIREGCRLEDLALAATPRLDAVPDERWGSIEVPATGGSAAHARAVLPVRCRAFLRLEPHEMRRYIAAWRRLRPDGNPDSARSLLATLVPWSPRSAAMRIAGAEDFDPFPGDDPGPGLVERSITSWYRLVMLRSATLVRLRGIDAPEPLQDDVAMQLAVAERHLDATLARMGLPTPVLDRALARVPI